ncbi:hypothetical protein ACTPEF_26470, partial [Clostridioides difficile]
CRRIVRFNGKCDVLMLDKPVVPFGKLRFQHIGILGADRVKIVGLDISKENDEIVDVSDSYVIPGGIDTHTHFDLDTGVTKTADN